MKSLNNDWETIEFEAVTPEQVRRGIRPKPQDGFDPYNSGVRWKKPINLEETGTIEIWYP